MSLYIHLDKITDNINVIKKYTKKDIMAVIKNDAYGIGSKKVIMMLLENNVKWLVYNTFSEYIKDIDVNHHFNILILESISNIKQIKYDDNIYYSVNKYEDFLYVKDIQKYLNIHIQVDCGLNREGIKDIVILKKIINILKNNEFINIDGIYTHYSTTVSDYENYDIEKSKFKEFIKLYEFKNIHSASTSSIYKNIIGNMVRVGLSLYGYGNKLLPLNPIINYTCKLIKVFNVMKNEKVGYYNKYITKKDLCVGLVDIGYSDVSNIKYLSYDKFKFNIIGLPCMNHMFIDVDKKINNITHLNVLTKNDIISYKEYDWYHILLSLRNVPKNYIRRYNNDISCVYKRTNKKNKGFTFRRRSN